MSKPDKDDILSTLLEEVIQLKEMVSQQQYDKKLIEQRFQDIGKIVSGTSQSISRAAKAG